jgi:fatty acid desaturase
MSDTADDVVAVVALLATCMVGGALMWLAAATVLSIGVSFKACFLIYAVALTGLLITLHLTSHKDLST